MDDELIVALAQLTPEHLAQFTALAVEQARVDVQDRLTLEARINAAAALAKQDIGDAVMWAEDEHAEIWVTRSNAGHTVERRPKPGSPAARRAELEAQATQARTVLLDPGATVEQITEATRIASLASLAGITVTAD